jgi:Uma2 family endonuclease
MRDKQMTQTNPLINLPPAEELPDSDDKPVDNELQILIPALLFATLSYLWRDREDWFFGINMGVYHTTGKNPRIAIVPDAFLALGVPRRREKNGRLSYIVWLEDNIPPILTLEHVSQNYGGEYDWEETKRNDSPKMRDYARLGVLYYVICNPGRYRIKNHQPFEVYRLVEGNYILQSSNPVWMPEIGLGIGYTRGNYNGLEQEWVYWFNEQGERYQVPDEIIQQERQKLELERQRAESERQRAEAAQRRSQELESLLQRYREQFGDLPEP